VPNHLAAEDLGSLRQAIAAIETGCVRDRRKAPRAPVTLGIEAADAMLGGGLNCEAVHEILPAAAGDLAAATGFALALAARAGTARRHVLYVQHDFTAWEGAPPYAPGLAQLGIGTRHLTHLRVGHVEEALWALAEALKCRAFAAVIGEFPANATALDLTATRRLVLAAQQGDGIGFLLRHAGAVDANAATTRWQVSAAPSRSDEFGGIGCAVFALELLKNRFGPCGRWTLGWNHHEHCFAEPALSLGMARTVVDRPDRAQTFANAG
jgi:protein ImuA